MSNIISLLIQSRSWIALAAASLALETDLILLGHFQSPFFYSGIFFMTLFAYNLYYVRNFANRMATVFVGISGMATTLILILFPHLFRWNMMLAIAILSSLYIIPIAFSKKLSSYNFRLSPNLKVVLLILVWLISTTLLSTTHSFTNLPDFIFLAYRASLVSILCLAFYIKDELKPTNIHNATNIIRFLLFVQVFAGIYLHIQGHNILGIEYILLTWALFLLIQYTLKHGKSENFYLIYIDGFMILHAGISCALYLLFKSSYPLC
ncbi:MAG: hypothetical protein KA198_08465 [Chitinophagaceae bacterium]|nr:hypothetical protein [Chitinophagaceae bacterium]